MNQQTLSDIEYSGRRKKTRREKFLMKMDRCLPWERWVGMIRPLYPSGKRGRKPKDLQMMLRMYCLQEWYSLSGAGVQDAIGDSYAMRTFLHLDFLEEQVPDATTLLRFRRLIRRNGLDEQFRAELEAILKEEHLLLKKGAQNEASLIRSAGRR
ncbi:MAG: transposase [Lachnospiraceae bacterium]|jgi:IS5 family transposase|nr:transposase [Lachnospiraceae bacterium]MCI1327875.1 transposase [Lachnospiraceae bacterium]